VQSNAKGGYRRERKNIPVMKNLGRVCCVGKKGALRPLDPPARLSRNYDHIKNIYFQALMPKMTKKAQDAYGVVIVVKNKHFRSKESR